MSKIFEELREEMDLILQEHLECKECLKREKYGFEGKCDYHRSPDVKDKIKEIDWDEIKRRSQR